MTNSILKAEVAQVAIGYASVEGLMDESGKFYVALPQISQKFNFSDPQKNLARDVKALLPEASQTFIKLKTKLNPKAVNALSIKDFEVLLAKLDRSGNVLAQQFRDDLVGLSLHQVFCDSFGIKFEADDRQAWLKTRMSGMIVRKDLGDSTKAYILRHPELSENAVRWMYKLTTDAVYKVIFDRNKKKLTSDLQADPPAFIQHNDIDVLTVSMDVIVEQFFKAQLAIIKDAGSQALGFLE